MKENKATVQSLAQYEFEQTTILAGINAIGEVVALKPIVENLGLSWPAQQRVIKNDPKMNQLLLTAPSVGSDGKLRDMLCMRQDHFQEWLWQLNPKSENFKVELWESYKKGLVIFILGMLKVSLDELGKDQEIKLSFAMLKDLNDEKKVFEQKLSDSQADTRYFKSELIRIQNQIDEILSRKVNQLSLNI